jgi:hypothetical protein
MLRTAKVLSTALSPETPSLEHFSAGDSPLTPELKSTQLSDGLDSSESVLPHDFRLELSSEESAAETDYGRQHWPLILRLISRLGNPIALKVV